MNVNTKNTMSDDEEDLEFLRLAALQTIKKAPPTTNVPLNQFPDIRQHNYVSPQHNKRGRGFHSTNNRGRNGQFNNKFAPRNTNLISITTTEPDIEVQDKLILPQHRYCNKDTNVITTGAVKENISKFSRYEDSDSDDSESESDESKDSENSDSESPGKLEKASSLDALMDELEFEITGENKIKELEQKVVKVKTNKRKNKRQGVSETETTDSDAKIGEVEVNKNGESINEVPKMNEEIKNLDVIDLKVKDNLENKRTPPHIHRNRSPTYRKRTPPPINGIRRGGPDYHNHFPPPFVHNQNNYMNPINPYNPTVPPYPPPFHHQINTFNPPPMNRQLSPLNINAEALNTITMAPLSPRSAAFVLQNREIVERRKKSPRRSYSRSPSPRFRRSKSPRFDQSPNQRRSLSPRKFARSISPKRVLRNVSPLQPNQRRNSPQRTKLVGKSSPKRRNKTPPKSVRDRLGTRPKDAKPIDKRKRTPTPDLPIKITKTEAIEDPILEARRKKFEESEIATKAAGIIRLKPKIDDEKIDDLVDQIEENEDSHEDEILDEDILDTKVDDIFSDEESDDENEGRFKTNTQTKRNVSVLPFTQLVNGPNRNIKMKALSDNPRDNPRYDRRDNRARYDHRDRKRVHERERRRPRSKSPKKDEVVKKLVELDVAKETKKLTKSRISYKHEKRVEIVKVHEHEKVRVTSPIENKKIEIKIRNPAKYETTSNYDVVSEEEMNKRCKGKSARKVAVAKELKENEVDDDPEVVIDDEEDLVKKNEGDLRAQLSRKRAERQHHHKLPDAEDVQTRLLQNALQGAVFKKSSKSKRKDKDTASNDFVADLCNGFKRFKAERINLFDKERRVHLMYPESRFVLDNTDKLPIHSRLGLTNDANLFMETKKRKKSKNRDLDQV